MTDVGFRPPAPGPYGRAAAVTKSDTVVQNYSSLWIGGAGNVAVIPAGQDNAITILAVAAGTLLPIAVSKVMSTNTTATNIVGLS